jgi:superfamily II RNA helicase
LILSELIFEGVLNDLSPAHICSLLSVFFTDMPKTTKIPVIQEAGQKAFAKLQDIAKRVRFLSFSFSELS